MISPPPPATLAADDAHRGAASNVGTAPPPPPTSAPNSSSRGLPYLVHMPVVASMDDDSNNDHARDADTPSTSYLSAPTAFAPPPSQPSDAYPPPPARSEQQPPASLPPLTDFLFNMDAVPPPPTNAYGMSGHAQQPQAQPQPQQYGAPLTPVPTSLLAAIGPAAAQPQPPPANPPPWMTVPQHHHGHPGQQQQQAHFVAAAAAAQQQQQQQQHHAMPAPQSYLPTTPGHAPPLTPHDAVFQQQHAQQQQQQQHMYAAQHPHQPAPGHGIHALLSPQFDPSATTPHAEYFHVPSPGFAPGRPANGGALGLVAAPQPQAPQQPPPAHHILHYPAGLTHVQPVPVTARKKKPPKIPTHVPNLGPLEDYATLTIDGEDMTFKCKTCGKVFRRIYNLKSHIKTHSNERPHACSLCGKAFLRKADMFRHMKIHLKEKDRAAEAAAALLEAEQNGQTTAASSAGILGADVPPSPHHAVPNSHSPPHSSPMHPQQQPIMAHAPLAVPPSPYAAAHLTPPHSAGFGHVQQQHPQQQQVQYQQQQQQYYQQPQQPLQYAAHPQQQHLQVQQHHLHLQQQQQPQPQQYYQQQPAPQPHQFAHPAPPSHQYQPQPPQPPPVSHHAAPQSYSYATAGYNPAHVDSPWPSPAHGEFAAPTGRPPVSVQVPAARLANAPPGPGGLTPTSAFPSDNDGDVKGMFPLDLRSLPAPGSATPAVAEAAVKPEPAGE
ncbi:hypothetical protein AMAG_17998 [Allomyces macrogynus ATCC 38327]|uniref:C2H2-type domain-containing protein n=1 Tax=Allomyces macrogynus (strain ATCC 38327) TaxID=578462 RepID=A0A0L0S3E2_ALLM3|nr:hypothetical protein AMAG_17998 [Allomyces macrogynus ATCC 38327]|eukprot:KNE57053.1 hypothetical protein AMAG_17998 [Allomyces macrogynus ATCC 38327]